MYVGKNLEGKTLDEYKVCSTHQVHS
jgi:hypothetical protein